MAKQHNEANESRRAKHQPTAPIGEDLSEQDQEELLRDHAKPQRARNDGDNDGNPDRVEIGDPVPEGDRTIKARGAGETGEDEDLPSDAGV